MSIAQHELAKKLLLRKRCGGRRAPFTKRQKIGYATWFGLFFVALILTIYIPDDPLSWLLIGLVSGVTLREYKWYSASRAIWPFQEKVIDWERVEILSQLEGTESAS